MTLGIMQPYLFPYIGYWQLINIVDAFVIYDDVNFIKQGYINKNNILAKDKAQPFTLELIGASSNKLINEVIVGNNSKKILKTIKQNYIKAPYFDVVFPLIEDILNNKESDLSKFIGYSLFAISNFLEIDTKFIYSSDIEKNNNLKAQDKVIEICNNLNANNYINSIGGKELYSKKDFNNHNIDLSFIETNLVEYKQYNNKFLPYLSIVDIMMFNDIQTISTYLKNYKLV